MAKLKRWIETPRTNENLLTQLLANRGITESADRDIFLAPDFSQLYDPLRLLQMDKLVSRLQEAIEKQEPIAIFGDYDHDGTPAAALLSEGITRCGGLVQTVYIPSREEGYSISKTIVDLLADQKNKLLILVDCGITNKPELDYAKEKGIDSIVIDHHVVQDDKFPNNSIVVNPKQNGDTYPFKELCGCGLAFKVITALAQATKKISADQLKWFLDLVAISTVCDMVPLIDENRILVHYGMIVLSKTKRLGLQKLYAAAAIDSTTISTYTIGFGIGPRLNAPGRMERASIAYQLLVTEDQTEAEQLAQRLEALNRQRQEELDRVMKAADASVVDNKLNDKKVILVSGDGWSDGVVGLVAGRITEKYSRPSLVLSRREDGLAKGSARSIDGFHLVDALHEASQYLVKYGGHAKAAGLTLAQDQLETLYDKLIEIAEEKLQEDDLKPKLVIDAQLTDSEVSLETVGQLAKLEPHGLGNPRPLFRINNCRIVRNRTMGHDGKHLKLSLELANGQSFDGVGFSLGSRREEATEGEQIDIVGMLDRNEWQGRVSLQFKLLDWRPSASQLVN